MTIRVHIASAFATMSMEKQAAEQGNAHAGLNTRVRVLRKTGEYYHVN